MFIYNMKINKKIISKAFIICALIIIISIITFSIYIIFFKSNSKSPCEVNPNSIIDLNENNYTNFLKSANENVDSYIGSKVRITGYIYRLLDFNENEFVIARDMLFNNNSQSLVVGFLCNYDKASSFDDGTWVEIIGKIKKGSFNGDIAILDVNSIKKVDEPQNVFVNPPDNTYISTSQK